MKNKVTIFLFAIFLIALSVALGLNITDDSQEYLQILTSDIPLATTPVQPCVPAFADGGGPYYLPNQPFREKLVPDNHGGQTLVVQGQLWQSDCKTFIPNAVLDIWQADETGEYQDDWYRGQVSTGENGEYRFETAMPKGYGEGTGYRPPHLHFKVHIDDQLIATSQMFFEDTRGMRGFNDAYIIPIQTIQRDGQEVLLGNYNIVLN